MAETILSSVPNPGSLAQAIIDTVRTPLLVLDADLRVLAASRSYYAMFGSDEATTVGRSLYGVSNGQWDVADLRGLVDKVLTTDATIEAYEIEFLLPQIGLRTLLLDARKVFYADKDVISVLLGFEDVTALRIATREKDEALQQKTMLLQEMHYRVANSLQIIASILLLKARAVGSEEIRGHLRDAHQRVMSVAAVQSHLQASSWGDRIDVAPYLTTLCESLAKSMIYDKRPVALSVNASGGLVSSAQATSLGLIVTELVINALKYAFGEGDIGHIAVNYTAEADRWTLSVADDERGLQSAAANPDGTGLGSSLIAALAEQLGARVEHSDLAPGLTVTVINDGVAHPPPPRRRTRATAPVSAPA